MSKQVMLRRSDRITGTLAAVLGFTHSALSTGGIQGGDNTQMTGHGRREEEIEEYGNKTQGHSLTLRNKQGFGLRPTNPLTHLLEMSMKGHRLFD